MTVQRLPWFIAGPALGLTIVALRALVNKPFGALGGYIDVAENVGAPTRIGLRGFMLVGLIIGGLAFALVGGTFGGALPVTALPGRPLAQAMWFVAAGTMMGFGARAAGGCTSGHGMTGMSLASPASIVASMTFFAVAVGVANVLELLGGAR